MAARLYITLFLITILGGCTRSRDHERFLLSLDSTSAEVQTVIADLERVDTASILKSLSIYRAYRDFLVSEYSDSLSLADGQNLSRYERACKQLEYFIKNRRLYLERAQKVHSQLSDLRYDAVTKASAPDDLRVDLRNEKNAVTDLSSAVSLDFSVTANAVAQVDSGVGLIRRVIGTSNKK